MKKTKPQQEGIIGISGLSASELIKLRRIQQDYEERTVWRKDLIMTYAKAISLFMITLASSIALCLVVYFQDSNILEKIVEIIMCVLSFLAGRSKRQ